MVADEWKQQMNVYADIFESAFKGGWCASVGDVD